MLFIYWISKTSYSLELALLWSGRKLIMNNSKGERKPFHVGFFSLGSKSAVILGARDKVGPRPHLQLMPLMNGIGRAAHAGHEPGTGWAPMGPTSRVCQPARVNRARQCAPPVPGTPSTLCSCRAPAGQKPPWSGTRQPCAGLQAVPTNAVPAPEDGGGARPVPWVATTGTLAIHRGF